MINPFKKWLRKKSEPPEYKCQTDNEEQDRAAKAYEEQLARLKLATKTRRGRTLTDVRQKLDSADALMREALGGNKP